MTRTQKHRHPINLLFLTVLLIFVIACDNTDLNERQLLENAKSHLDNGNLPAAAIELRNTLKVNNKNPEARFLLGGIMQEVGYLTSAEKEFRRAAAAGWNEEPTNLELARVLVVRKKYKNLLDDINIKDSWSSSTRANISALRALAEASLFRTPQAISTLKESKSYDINAFEVLKTTIQFELTGILDSNASSTLDKARALYPNNSELLLLYATNDLHNENTTRAIETLNKIISKDSSKLITRHGRSARIALARIQITEKHFDQADATLAPLLKSNHRDPVANYLTSLLAFSLNDYSRAELHMRKLLKLAPEHSQSQQLMGNIKFALQDYDQAANHLAASLTETPNNLLIYRLLAKTYIALNKPLEAKLSINKALLLSPNDAETLSLLSQLNFTRGNKKAGVSTLKDAISHNPENSSLHKQLAIAYIVKGEVDKAHAEILIFQRLSNNTFMTQKLFIRAYLQSGDLNKAIEIADKLLTNDSQNPEILTINGQLQTEANNNQLARKFFDKALKFQHDYTAAAIGLARLDKKFGNTEKAIIRYKSLVENNEGNLIPMLALAELAHQQGRTNDMLAWLEKVREVSATDIKSRALLAKYYFQSSEIKNANKYIQEAIKISPDTAELSVLHGKILMAQKRYRESLIPIKRALNQSPSSTEARILFSTSLLRLQMTETARKHLQIALKNNPDNARIFSLLAETELQDKNYDKSLEYAKRFQDIHPNHHIGHMQEGKAWLAKQDYNKAQLALNQAWQQKNTANIAQLLFAASKHIGSFEKAIEPLLSWLQDHPDDNATQLSLAFAYLNSKRNEEAIHEYEDILKKTPDDKVLLNNLAWLYSLDENPKAVDFAERAFRLSPEDPGVLDTYGWILVRTGQIEKGQRHLKLAMKKTPGNLDIQYHYAASLIHAGDTIKGRQILEKLLKNKDSFVGRHDAEKLLSK